MIVSRKRAGNHHPSGVVIIVDGVRKIADMVRIGYLFISIRQQLSP